MRAPYTQPSTTEVNFFIAGIDWGGILNVIVASTIAGLCTTTIFAGVVLATARSTDARNKGHRKASVLYAIAAVVALAAFAGLVAFGIQIMLAND